MRALNMCLKMNPQYAKALVKRGEVYVAMEAWVEAVQDFSAAEQINPTGFGVKAKLKNAMTKNAKKERKDYYEILGVPKDADGKVIKKAYHKLAAKWHPDKQKDEHERENATSQMQLINEANAILTNKEKRKKYDGGWDPNDPNKIVNPFTGFEWNLLGGLQFTFNGTVGDGLGTGPDPSQKFQNFVSKHMGGIGS